MTKKLNVKLIDGEFKVEDGQDILLNLLQAKINYHQKKGFGLEERFGYDHLHGAMRIAELKESKQNVIDFLASIDKDGLELCIEGDIKVTVKKKEDETALVN